MAIVYQALQGSGTNELAKQYYEFALEKYADYGTEFIYKLTLVNTNRLFIVDKNDLAKDYGLPDYIKIISTTPYQTDYYTIDEYLSVKSEDDYINISLEDPKPDPTAPAGTYNFFIYKSITTRDTFASSVDSPHVKDIVANNNIAYLSSRIPFDDVKTIKITQSGHAPLRLIHNQYIDKSQITGTPTVNPGPNPPNPPDQPDPPDTPDPPDPPKPKVWDFPFAKRNEYGIIEATLSGEYEGITFTVNSGESITWDNKLDPMFLIYGSTLATSVTATDKDGVSKTRPLESSDINSPSDDPFVFDDKNFLPDTEDTPPNWTNPFVDDWPAITFFHQQRLGFASSIKRPVTVWMSQPQAFECFATKTPPTAEDMIEATIASQQVNRINWASTDKGRLALGLDNAEWVLTGLDSEVCSPLSLKFTRYTEHGSAPYHKAIMTDAGLVHIKKDGQTVRTYSYTFSNDEYQSSDLTILARHLLADNPITSWAWQQEPLSTFYIATSQKNLLLNLTFLKEHDVVAWSAQIMNGEISSVINLLDDIYFIMKRRKANGAIVNTLEKVAPYFVLNGEAKSDKAFAIHLDSASLKGI